MLTKILVVGGAGYIGSHMVKYLQQHNYIPVVLDNLSTGHATAVLNAELIVGDMSDEKLLNELFRRQDIQAVMHFASFIQVGESVQDPAKYYHNNVAKTLTLLQTMLKHRIKYFIFSSTAAVYGEPLYTPIDENHPLLPINPYGQSKWMVEKIIDDFSCAYDFCYASLRYFNAAGADPDGQLGEWHEPETHLIPLVLQAALKKNTAITIFGQDYPTPDGTCVRDYVHVLDLCKAHLLALQALLAGQKREILNLGTGIGFSVQQVIESAKQITQSNIPIRYVERRAGDPAILVANANRARQQLNWQPHYSDLQTIIKHAWLAMKTKYPVLTI